MKKLDRIMQLPIVVDGLVGDGPGITGVGGGGVCVGGVIILRFEVSKPVLVDPIVIDFIIEDTGSGRALFSISSDPLLLISFNTHCPHPSKISISILIIIFLFLFVDHLPPPLPIHSSYIIDSFLILLLFT